MTSVIATVVAAVLASPAEHASEVSIPRPRAIRSTVAAPSALDDTGHTKSVKPEVASAEKQIYDTDATLASALERGDTSVVSDAFTDNYLFVDAAGRVHDGGERLASATAPITVYDAVHLHGRVAIVVGRSGDTRVLRVWVQQDQRWRVASEQAVAIQPGAVAPSVTPLLLPMIREVPPLDAPGGERVAEVLRAQDALDRANAMRDPSTFARLTDANFVVVTSHGLVRTKVDRVIEERIARLERQPERPMPRRDDVRVRMFGTVAIVTARNWPRAWDGGPQPPTRYTRVWMKESPGWQQVANISTWVMKPQD